MSELICILEGMREKEYSDRKFTAAMKGVDLDKETGRKNKAREPAKEGQKKVSTFEDIRARVASGGRANDANDILALQGSYGASKGFQMGKDMAYASFTEGDTNAPKSPMDF